MGSQQGNDTSAASSVSVAPNPLSDTFTSLMADGPIEVREGYADVGDQTLHYVEAGDGPLLVLLHGFPEFWFGWRLQIQPLAAAGFRVVAPDTRGYNLYRSPRDSRRTASIFSPTTFAVSSERLVPSLRIWWVTIGAAPSRGPLR